mmetsp:Transcript_14807/g.21011  ORF Transcript_14807/g.21011 Transcript_14807/m.21011 type:complete len:366 (-) Transcript_14807:61-1158(-)
MEASNYTTSPSTAADAAITTKEQTNTPSTATEDPPLSKKALKRQKRWEKTQAIKKRRKEQSKEIRRIKAQNEGRDLDAEREQQKQNEKEGKGWARREKLWRERCQKGKIDESFRVCFDCNFEDQMTWKEVNSLSLQLRYAYAMNRKSPMPLHVHVTGVKGECDTRKHLEKIDGFPDSWAGRAYHVHEESLEDVFGSALSNVVPSKGEEVKQDNDEAKSEGKEEDTDKDNSQKSQPMLRPNHQLVYLTGDSENTLSTLDNNTTYIIGGIVDRNRLKRAAIERAEAIGSNSTLPIKTARLPLDEHLEFKGSTRILTCNHVFEILLKYRENGYKDWGKAVLSVLPDRKDIHEKEEKKEEPQKDEEDKS